MINPRGQEDPRPFVSFVPMSGTHNNETDKALSVLQYILQGGSTEVYGSTFDVESEDNARIYVVVNDALGTDVSFGLSANKTIECGLYNMSYSVEFAFSNGQPKLTILNTTLLNGVGGQAECDYSTLDERDEAPVCSPEAVAYMALLSAFSQQLVGFLEQSHYGYITSILTQVAKTAFMDTKELYESQYYMDHGTNPDTRPPDAMGMTQALEEVFTNATLSLFSEGSFL